MAKQTKAQKETERENNLTDRASRALLEMASRREKPRSISWTEQDYNTLVYCPTYDDDECNPRGYKPVSIQSPTHLIDKEGFEYIKRHGIEGETTTICGAESPGPEEYGGDFLVHPKKVSLEEYCHVCLEAFKRSGLPASKLPDDKWVEVFNKYTEDQTCFIKIQQDPKDIIRIPIRPEEHKKAEEVAAHWLKGKPFSLHGFEYSILKKSSEYIDLQMRVQNTRIWAERRMYASRKSYLGKMKIYRSVLDHQKSGSLIVANHALWMIHRASIVTSPVPAILGQSASKNIDLPWADDSRLMFSKPSIRSEVRVSFEPIQRAADSTAT